MIEKNLNIKSEIIGITNNQNLPAYFTSAVAARSTKQGGSIQLNKELVDIFKLGQKEHSWKNFKGKDLTNDNLKEYVERIAYEVGHSGVLEHTTIVVAIENISRLAVNYLEHHRIASYDEQSFRVNQGEIKLSYDKDNFIKDNHVKIYKHMIETGLFEDKTMRIKPEDARYFLTYAIQTSLIASANIKEWRKIITNLLSANLEEARILGQQLFDQINKEFPLGELKITKGWSPFTQLKLKLPSGYKYRWNVGFGDMLQPDQIPPGNPRCSEGKIFRIQGELSGVAYDQLKRHRMGTMWVTPLSNTMTTYKRLPPNGCFTYPVLIDKMQELIKAIPEKNNPYFMPMGILRRFIWIVNKRSMINFLQQRLSPHAQTEIRQLANFITQFDSDFKACFPRK
jgi:thymidylate synthase ThyX